MRLLLAEDDPDIGAAAVRGLAQRGFAVDWVKDGPSALTALASGEHFDALLLDLGLPGLDGHDVLRRLRAEGRELPVLVLTARDAVSDKVRGLDEGADDYLVKPFDLDELAARLRALVRRRGGRAGPRIVHRELELDPAQHRLTQAGVEVPLSPREFAILHALMERPGQVLSRQQLEERLYSWDSSIESNAVDVHLHALRRKLGSGLILNVRGVGWRLPP
ncbi:DNA-binding response regulator [Stagnimonas aquatica]|uniref:DNA-binding response regulator n=1 Tax=Stagnimonas aquatica TaxID=2689987 RepID=A0A3N0VKN4_9GAMM|nr:response regulator transcription factor [Stagnimonas aquatica]ROH93342.1 DNA-binding response regulator [Stagnimonas aquatica]